MPLLPSRVMLVARPSFAEPLRAELERDATLVHHEVNLDTALASSFAVVVVEVGHGDWRSLLSTGASVIVFADHASCDVVEAALEAGADDVITRADRPHEAVARIRAIARRRPRPLPPDGRLRVGEVELDPDTRRVAVGGRPVELTRKQFDLLEYFLRNPGRVVTRDTLLEHVWDFASTQDVNAVEVQVRRLRAAIGDDLRHPRLLRTIRGVGYLFERQTAGDSAAATTG